MEIKVKKLDDKATMPRFAKFGDAGADVVAVSVDETDKFIEYGTGLAFEVPRGYVMMIHPRSSVSKKDLILANSVGVLDSGYRGELKIRFKKLGDDVYEIGERVAQVIIQKYEDVNYVEFEDLGDTDRGTGGFGSSGV